MISNAGARTFWIDRFQNDLSCVEKELSLGSDCLVLSDANAVAHAGQLLEAVGDIGTRFELLVQRFSEPSVESILSAREMICTVPTSIIAVGGGSTIDTAKLLSVLISSPDLDLPNVFTVNWPVIKQSKPNVIAVPCTVGPGAEYSPAAIYSIPSGKIGVVGESLVPDAVIYAPQVLSTLPWEVNCCSLVDGVAHSVEGLISTKCSARARDLHLGALNLMLDNFPADREEPLTLESVSQLQIATSRSAIATRMTGVNCVHTLASLICRLAAMPHGRSVAEAFYLLIPLLLKKDYGRTPGLSSVLEDVSPKLQRMMSALPRVEVKYSDVADLDLGFLYQQQQRLAECVLTHTIDDLISLATSWLRSSAA